MAGPGGGPPRKSHTKSKKGCKTCKRRHIRCDETFPQCRNCTKHNCRCDYQDQVAPGEDYAPSSSTSGAAPSPSPEQEIAQWAQTKIFPFHELNLQNTHQFSELGRTELRLIHYLCNAYRQLYQIGSADCAPWISQLPVFLEISGRGHKCVLSALLAFSAQKLAIGQISTEMTNLADGYRAFALQTIQEALGHFSQHNADSILATSIILSWQVDDLASWNSLMQGISTVISHMGDWRFSSPIASFAESNVLARPTALAGPDHSLGHAIAAAQQLSDSMPKEHPLRSLIEGVWQSGLDINNQSRSASPEQLFQRIAYLRNRVLWTPIDCVAEYGLGEMGLVGVAHCFALASAADASMPDLHGACLGALSHSGIGAIDRNLHFNSSSSTQSPDHYDAMMQFPRHMMQRFPSVSSEPVFSLTQAGTSSTGSPYGFENLDLHSSPGTPPFPPALPYHEAASEMSVPSSPYLHSFGSHRQSGHFQSHRPASIYSDRGNLSVPPAHDSPAFSPSFPPQTFQEPDSSNYFGYGHDASESPMGFASGSPSLTRSSDRGKGRSQQ